MRGEPIHTRRQFLAASAAVTAAATVCASRTGASKAESADGDDQALVAITLDLEMARNFPKWEDGHWDYEKGNLDGATKAYAVEAARRVRARGGVVHFFLVGRALEQADVAWLKGIAGAGHPIGNHTYDHVNVRATRADDIQYRFARAPWLIEGKEPADVIRENIRLCTAAMRSRLGVEPAGFRTPGGFADGLADRADIRRMLLDLGFSWVSSKYPAHLPGDPGAEPPAGVRQSLLDALPSAQPFAYPDGLVEVPMAPPSDIAAFRTGRWKLESFLDTIRAGVEQAIERRAVFDFLGHPSCLNVTDPEFRTIDLICDLVNRSQGRAKLTDIDTIAGQARRQPK